MKISKKIISTILAVTLFSSISINAFALIPEYAEEYTNLPTTKYEKVFDDVKKSYWAFDYIMEMVNRGVLSGYPNGKFYPDNTITRAEFSKIMCIASGITVTNTVTTSYKDVKPTDWYAPYVEAGKYYLSGYISNNERYYLPETNALREDIAVALVKLKGYDTSLADESILKTMFKDYQSISQGARKYVAVAVENGLISGYDDDTFRGQDTVTRAEAATLLWRAYQYGNGNKVFDKEELDLPVQTPVPETIITIEKEDDDDKVENDETDTSSKEESTLIDNKDEEELPESEYLYELKTIGTGITDVETMIAFSNGVFFMSDDVVYEVTKDGNTVNVLLDGNDMDYLGGGEISKAEKSYLKTFVRYLGYDPLSDERYCILSQTVGDCPILLYNIDTGEYIDITKIMRSKEVECYSNLGFAPDESFLLDEFGNIVISQTIIDYVNNKVYGFQAGSQGSCTQLFVDNNIYIPSKSIGINIYKYNKRTGLADEKLDYFIPEKSNFISADNKYFYFRTDSGNIYRVDTNGDSELLFGVDDIDNVDGRLINIGSIKYLTSVISNGVIYYWDVNYNSIRQLSHK